jgi:hypothetical protein
MRAHRDAARARAALSGKTGESLRFWLTAKTIVPDVMFEREFGSPSEKKQHAGYSRTWFSPLICAPERLYDALAYATLTDVKNHRPVMLQCKQQLEDEAWRQQEQAGVRSWCPA